MCVFMWKLKLLRVLIVVETVKKMFDARGNKQNLKMTIEQQKMKPFHDQRIRISNSRNNGGARRKMEGNISNLFKNLMKVLKPTKVRSPLLRFFLHFLNN